MIRVNNYRKKCLRYLSAAVIKQEGPLFPPKDDFPGRHIGPRESDIISMLDTLGFKVMESFLYSYSFMNRFKYLQIIQV